MATTMPRSAALFDSPDTFALDWKGLYQEHGPRLRRIAERRVGTAQAEDVVQDAFMRAFRNRTSLDPSRPIGAWLSSITLYSSTDALRRRSARPELPVDGEPEPVATGCTVEDEFENAVRRMGIEKAFDSLNLRQRRVLKRLEVDGWTQEQVAADEQISTEAVKSLAARARRTFREVYTTFAENMGVFGGAVVGPAVLRLRARIQRLQGLAVEHVGAFSVAAATVTVVAIATVPSARPVPTNARESDVPVAHPARGTDSPAVASTPSSVVVEPKTVVSYTSPAGTKAQDDATQESSSASVRAEAQVERHGGGATALVTAGAQEEEGERRLYGGVELYDCTRDTVSRVGCAAIDTLEGAPPGD